jgi:3-oxoacyl-[acyl-carrier-protein] synthase-1
MDMRRVVITGMGAACSLGLTLPEIEESLRRGRSGITYCPDFAEHGFNSLVAGWIADWDAASHLPFKSLKTMGRGSEFSSYAGLKALEDSGLAEEMVQSDRTGVVIGCGEGSTMDMFQAAYAMKEHNKPRRVGIRVPQTMSSSRSANLTLLIKNRGISLGLSAACATGLVNIGYAFQLIRWGLQEIVFAGGADSCDWAGTSFFDAMGVLSSAQNDHPEKASRPFDKDRDGFIMAEGGGVVVVEVLEHAQRRGAKIYGEILGYAANCDGGYSIVAPWPDGAVRCMQAAMADAGVTPTEIEYINPHGTSTEAGDPSEIEAINRVFTDHKPMLSSTKSQIGHTIGAAGALEFIAALLMLNGGFIAPSLNLDQPDEKCRYDNFVTRPREVRIDTFLTNNFAFGGSNAAMIVRRF